MHQFDGWIIHVCSVVLLLNADLINVINKTDLKHWESATHFTLGRLHITTPGHCLKMFNISATIIPYF